MVCGLENARSQPEPRPMQSAREYRSTGCFVMKALTVLTTLIAFIALGI
jgi:hypothetical protein